MAHGGHPPIHITNHNNFSHVRQHPAKPSKWLVEARNWIGRYVTLHVCDSAGEAQSRAAEERKTRKPDTVRVVQG